MTFKRLTVILIFSTIFSCNEAKLKSPLLDDLTATDTVTLFARYSECGEWGGHIEKIFLTKKEDNLMATFYKDTIICVPGPDFGKKRTKLYETSKILTIKERNKIIQYIDTLVVATKANEFPESNSSYRFEVLTEDSTYEYINWKKNWKEFNRLEISLKQTPQDRFKLTPHFQLLF